MSAKSYGQKLQDPRWQRRRLEILERDKFECIECGDAESTLHVHHKYYVRGRDPWEYDGDALSTLCERCHVIVQERMDRLHSVLSRLGESDVDVLIGYCLGVKMVRAHHDGEIHGCELLSYEEGLGMELALSSGRPYVGETPACEYLSAIVGLVSTANPMVMGLVESAGYK